MAQKSALQTLSSSLLGEGQVASTAWQMDFTGSEVLAVGSHPAMARNPFKVCAEDHSQESPVVFAKCQDSVGAGAWMSLESLYVKVVAPRHQGRRR